MNNEQQVRVLSQVTDGYGDEQAHATLRGVIDFVVRNSRDGYTDFSIEDFVSVILGE